MLKPSSLGDSPVAETGVGETLPLTSVTVGAYRVVRLAMEGRDEARVRRLGVCDGRRIDLLGVGDPLMISVGNSRVGISRLLAANVLVERIGQV